MSALRCVLSTTEINFSDQNQESRSQVVTLYNPYPYKLFFSVKSTAPRDYAVNPSSGTLSPNKQIDISFTLTAPHITDECNDKFLVEVEGGSPLQRHERRIKAKREVVEMPSSSSSTCSKASHATRDRYYGFFSSWFPLVIGSSLVWMMAPFDVHDLTTTVKCWLSFLLGILAMLLQARLNADTT